MSSTLTGRGYLGFVYLLLLLVMVGWRSALAENESLLVVYLRTDYDPSEFDYVLTTGLDIWENPALSTLTSEPWEEIKYSSDSPSWGPGTNVRVATVPGLHYWPVLSRTVRITLIKNDCVVTTATFDVNLVPDGLKTVSFSLSRSSKPRPYLVPLYRWRNDSLKDDLLTRRWVQGSAEAQNAGYSFVAQEGLIFEGFHIPREYDCGEVLQIPSPIPANTCDREIRGIKPIHTWHSETRHDTTAQSEPVWMGHECDNFRTPDYNWTGVLGGAYDRPLAGTLPLCHWYNPTTEDNLVSTDPFWHLPSSTDRSGYRPIRVQGYIHPGSATHAPLDPGFLGYDTLRRDGFGARTNRALLLLLCEYSDSRFRSPYSVFSQIQHVFGPGAPSVADFFFQESYGNFTWTTAAILQITLPDDPGTPVDESTRSYAQADPSRHRRRLIQLAAAQGFDFSAYDLNGDGTVRTGELGVLIVNSDPPGETRGETRLSGAVTVNGVVVNHYSTVVAQETTIGTIAHQLGYQLGQENIYGASSRNQGYSLAAMPNSTSTSEVVHHDPWHKIRLGWVEPRIFSLTYPGASVFIDAPQRLGQMPLEEKRPVLLYDPARGKNEFFLLEYRTPAPDTLANYDSDVAGSGLVVWAVRTNPDYSLTRLTSGDVTCMVVGRNELLWGQGQPWQPGDSLALTYFDGSTVGATIRVGPTSEDGGRISVEWSREPALVPRVDQVDVTETTPCRFLRLRGMFPIQPADSVNITGRNQTYSCSVESWDIREILLELPLGISADDYELTLSNQGTPGNRFPFQMPEITGTVQFSAPTYLVNESAGSVTVRLSRTGAFCGAGEMACYVDAGSAEQGLDFAGSLTRMVQFGAGETDASLVIPIIQDTLDEAGETFRVRVFYPLPGSVVGSITETTVTIIDDDPPPSISVGSLETPATEYDYDSRYIDIPVILSGPSAKDITVVCSTEDGTALEGSDYRLHFSIASFPAGTTRVTRQVAILPDLLDEEDETFRFKLSSPVNATLDQAMADVTIQDNDPEPMLSINDHVVTEGDSGIQNVAFRVTLSAPSGRPITFSAATRNGTARAGEDYTARSLPSMSILPGDSEVLFPVTITATPGIEPDELFTIRLSNPVHAGLAKAEGRCEIKAVRLESIRSDGSDIVLGFPSASTGKIYYLERTERLGPGLIHWQQITKPASGLPGSGDTLTFRDAGAAAARRSLFYRLREEIRAEGSALQEK